MATILIVDDEPFMREMLQDILEECGHEVRTASDGAEAETALTGPTPDLVITDILMPNKGGLTLIRTLRARSAEVPVIAISGGGKDGKLNFLRTATTFPNVRSLNKPFGHQELLDVVHEMLG